jgi:cysteine desulfurase
VWVRSWYARVRRWRRKSAAGAKSSHGARERKTLRLLRASGSRPNSSWRGALERKLLAAVPHAVVFGADVERLANTACIAAQGVPSENMVIALDLDGFSVSAGAACSSGKVTQSHVLGAMGVEPRLASCAIRVSFGWNTTEQDLTAFAEAWIKIVQRAQARVAA